MSQLESIFQYRVLLSKALELHIPLSPADHLRLGSLRGQLCTTIPELDATAAPDAALDAEFACGGRFRAARLRSLSGGGLALETDKPPRPGECLLVHIWDPSHSIEYSFSTRVIDRAEGASAGMRVAFEGLPSKVFVMTRGRRARVGDTPQAAGRAKP
jgi:hypothetical protein